MPELEADHSPTVPALHQPGSFVAIVGGMGPLASARFLTSIYEYSLVTKEQHSPRILMISDPSFPDRTELLLHGDCKALQQRLEQTLRFVLEGGASWVVVCCITIHLLLPTLPRDLRKYIVSLVDISVEEIKKRRERHLLVCTTATRSLKLFEQHLDWPQVSDFIVYPTETDQRLIHNQILYGLKRKTDLGAYAAQLQQIMDRYGVRSFVAGCTELHLLAPFFMGSTQRFLGYTCIDALSILAQEIATRYQ